MTKETPYLIEQNPIKKYNPNYGDDRICNCDHPYYRHFDSYDNNYPCGCKYCGCCEFIEKGDKVEEKRDRAIYTITTISLNLQNTRCVGYCFKNHEAIEIVLQNCGDIYEAGYYPYCVIEEVKAGIYVFPRKEMWFEWNVLLKGYGEIPKKPKKFNNTCCFGIG